jgi:hypothetical protein
MKSLTMLVDKLIDRACMESMLSGDGRHMERMKQYGGYAKLPDRYKPCRLIMSLPPEDRETLKRATDKDFNHRLFK